MTEVDKYILQFEPPIQSRLKSLRELFFELYPNCVESIRYKIPAYKVGMHYLYFAAYTKHIGFYPVYGLWELEEELSAYRAKGTKDSLHFPHNKPLPIELVRKIIKQKAQLT
ncbi:DUF1801 domain-containing protein [Rhodocytophaga aerolata]|uniref:DUF1801 domain-containing protein n=1 Tax=Rhodocytophaga aerolata TaxID=455078 RepID=A0ABT8R527_9BACT|nr:DUF1801 domain-containing protein [Rhodocytophaga aerolata]MDO1447019.1 DUF1801 domain-containing protein [Rhodocytophaga aerolata]